MDPPPSRDLNHSVSGTVTPQYVTGSGDGESEYPRSPVESKPQYRAIHN